MRRYAALLVVSALICRGSDAQIVNSKPLSPRITGYTMNVELDPVAKTVSGSMKAYWVNISTDKVPDIQLHMYLNAFRNNKSTFLKESGRSPGSTKESVGWVEIRSMKDQYGNDLTKSSSFISPDDGNPDDMTVLRVMLPKPVNPGDTVNLDITFRSKLPSDIRRTGYADDFFFVGQWFPKIAVYEPTGMRYAVKGGWNCHQFHATSEFYANHSVYDVNITVPEKFVVGSGGMLLDEKTAGNGKKTLHYRAEDIVDFAWTAWPEYKVATDKWKNVNIRFLYPPQRQDQVARQLTAVKNALEYFDEHVGPYPWPHLTFVDPPSKGVGAGGMEYTTIFTSESADFMPEWMHMPEMVTIHEFGHAYFMGILASNEFEEPWVDEGVNSFLEERIVDHYYGAGGMIDHPWFKGSDQAIARASYIASGNNQVVSNAAYSWNYPHDSYGIMSYMKTATWLYTVMGILGEKATDEVFREYYREWAFKHPSGKDFIAVFNKVVPSIYGDKFGHDMNWYFDQVTYGTGICDYKVSGITNTRNTDLEGVVINGDSISTRKNEFKNDSIFTSSVQLERHGELMIPVEVLVHFDNGDKKLESWDGKDTYKDFTYTGKHKVDWVQIDPEYKNKMDVDYINNSMTLEPDRKPVRRLTGKYITFMEFLIDVLSL